LRRAYPTKEVMDARELKALTSICGIDCFNCEFFHTNIDAFFSSLSVERKAAFDARGMTIDKLRCQGCRVSGCTAINGRCETLECAKERQVDFCFDCQEFPCRRLQPVAEGAERYPHNLKVYNLTAIRSRGIEAWAAEVPTIRKRYFGGRFKIGAGPQLMDEK
jgi:hypothetical protein